MNMPTETQIMNELNTFLTNEELGISSKTVRFNSIKEDYTYDDGTHPCCNCNKPNCTFGNYHIFSSIHSYGIMFEYSCDDCCNLWDERIERERIERERIERGE